MRARGCTAGMVSAAARVSHGAVAFLTQDVETPRVTVLLRKLRGYPSEAPPPRWSHRSCSSACDRRDGPCLLMLVAHRRARGCRCAGHYPLFTVGHRWGYLPHGVDRSDECPDDDLGLLLLDDVSALLGNDQLATRHEPCEIDLQFTPQALLCINQLR